MTHFIHRGPVLYLILLLATLSIPSALLAQDKVIISYGGHNETVAPLWVGVDKGIFKKYGLDVSVLQVRNGQVSLTALMSGDVQAFWPAVSSVRGGVGRAGHGIAGQLHAAVAPAQQGRDPLARSASR